MHMKAPFHVRGPFMAKLWLLFALGIIGVQMVFVVNLLVKKQRGAGEPAVVPGAALAADRVDSEGEPAKLYREESHREREEEDKDNSVETGEQPPLVAPDNEHDDQVTYHKDIIN